MVNTDAAWSPDSRRIVAIANTVNEHWYGDDADLWLVGPGEGPATGLTPDGGHSWRLEGTGVAWSPDGATIYALSQRDGDRNIAAVPAGGGVRTPVTNVIGTVTDFVLSPDGGTLPLVQASPTTPPALFTLPSAGGRLRRLTDCYQRVARNLRARADPLPHVRWPLLRRVSLSLAGFRRAHAACYPGLIQVRGGGTDAYGNGWHPIEQWFARRGFVVLAIEYRGSSGYGRDFAALSYADWGGGQTRDTVAPGEWLRAQPYISAVGLYGQSYGGFLTLHGIVAAPALFAAAADLYGKTNMCTAQVTADRVERIFVARDYRGRLATEIPEAMQRASTHRRLREIRTPLLILHGDQDRRVPPVESARVAAMLAEADFPHEYVVYPGEGRGFRREHRIDRLTRNLAWFRR